MPSHFYLQSVLCWKAYSTKPRFCDSSLLRTVYFLPPGRVHRKLETTVSMETKDSLGPCSTICFFIILYIYIYIYQFSSVQLLSCVRLFVIPWTAARQASMSISNSQSLLKLMSIKSLMPSNRLILCHPLLLPSSIFPTIRVFSNESALCIRWPKYWSYSFNISLSNEYSGLISFSADWFDLSSQESPPAPQFKSSNSSVLNFLYDTTLTSMDDYWKNHSFD